MVVFKLNLELITMISIILLLFLIYDDGGGIKGGVLQGDANISSKVSNREIANGTASYQSFNIEYDDRIILKDPNYNTGINIKIFSPIIPRRFDQKIEISDFRKSINQPDNSNGKIIPVKITNLDGSETFDPSDPNKYEIEMTNSSLQTELRFRYPITLYSSLLFFEIGGSVSFLDEQEINVTLGNKSKKTKQDVWFFERIEDVTKLNRQIYGAIGFYEPSFGNIELGFQQIVYPKIELAETLEFRDSAESYDSQNNVFERERIFVDTFSLDITSFRLSYSFIF